MKQAKKIITRMLLNNWGGISHRMMEFHEYVNLFSGKSGSGKSTVMDAIQVVLYGSMSASFLNKAADDAKNRRSVMSYLRGEQKDGTANRGGQDFGSTLVLEIKDTGSGITTCFGVLFEIGRADTDINGKYTFFSHSGSMPEDEYLEEGGIPYSRGRMKKLCEARKSSPDNRGRGEVNRLYPSRESYVNTLYEVILGSVDAQRLMTMEKSAIALRMTNGTGQFIKDYMFPKSRESAIEKISEQLGAYREIKERVEDLERRIRLLSEIRESHEGLIKTRADMVHAETVLKYIEIESTRAHLETRTQDLKKETEAVANLQKQQAEEEKTSETLAAELVEVQASLRSSDYGQKQKELTELENTVLLLSGNSRQWRKLLDDLSAWETEETVSGYVSNFALQLLDEFRKGKVTEENCKELQKRLEEARENVEEELEDLTERQRILSAELEEKKEILDELKHDRKPYDKNLRQARTQLESALSNLYGKKAPVYILADLFDVTDEKWKNAVEGRLGRLKYSLVTAPEYALDAANLFRRLKKFQEVDLINTQAILKDQPQAQPGTLYEAVRAEESFVDDCLKRYLGRTVKCESVEELSKVRDGVTPDCYSYSNYMFRHLREKDYTLRACIGTKVSRTKMTELSDRVNVLENELDEYASTCRSLKKALNFEMLHMEPKHVLELSQAAADLERYYKKQEKLEKEICELQSGSLTAQLEAQKEELTAKQQEQNRKVGMLQAEMIEHIRVQGSIESDVKKYEENLAALSEGFVENEELAAEVSEQLLTQSETSYRNRTTRELTSLQELEQEQQENRSRARMDFNRIYASYGLSGVEKENDAYDRILEQCKRDYEPQYKEEFRMQCDQVYTSLRDNVIAAIHGEIKAAYRHAREINRLLSRIRFSDSTYQIEIRPADNENGQFYEMLMASELDSKVLDNNGFDGQMSLLEDEFYMKYKDKIDLLTEKFMPLQEGDAQNLNAKRQEMEQYADYRNYLTFSMYERVEDEDGSVRKNHVDEMAGRDSGGEGQNPKYVALLAGFAMLYMQQSSRESKVRLVLLDEAFSKMDKERSEVCLRYARELDLQLIVCVPDERLQSLIQNVDCVYGFRRFQNQISMMHIDKGDYLNLLEG
ncbi:hypothetical protein KFE18_12525 [Clostridiaceae bacterium Marseille-Q4143]|nr:hypothetical protein KFE18_12525 [Clostridiaceae bacterium Marseille-Q4143]